MKNLLISLFAIMAMVACTEGGTNEGSNNGSEKPTTPTITLNKTSVSFDEFADEEGILFSATANWIAEIVNDRTDGWLSVSPRSGKAGDASITIKVNDNDTPDDRNASVRIKAGTASKTINVVQSGVYLSTNEIRLKLTSLEYYDIVMACIAEAFGGNVTKVSQKNGWCILTLSDDYTIIPDYAFHTCYWSINEVIIGNGITTIGRHAFFSCHALESVTIPNSVTTIGEGVFACCESLCAFYGKFASSDNRCLIVDGELNSFAPMGLTEYAIPNSVTTIGGHAFSMFDNDDFIVYCKPVNPPHFSGYDIESPFINDVKIYVPAQSINRYREADGWKKYSIFGYYF